MLPERDKLVKLMSVVYEQTKAGKIPWEPTTTTSTFQSSLSDYSVLISEAYDPDEQSEYYIFKVCDEKGRTVDEMSQGEAYRAGFKDMHRLYQAARRAAMGADKAIDDLLNLLTSEPSTKR